jgi:hypothetical protein
MAGTDRGDIVLLSGIALGAAVSALVLRPRRTRQVPVSFEGPLAAVAPATEEIVTPTRRTETSWLTLVLAVLLACAMLLMTLVGPLTELLAGNFQLPLALLGLAAVLLAHHLTSPAH